MKCPQKRYVSQKLKQQRDHIKNHLISELKKRNPYPEDIFIPLSKTDIRKYVQVLIDNGFSSDQIHGHWGRYVWNLCVEELERLFEDE